MDHIDRQMQTKSLKADVLISGAGPAGSTLALLLAKAGLHVALVDAERPQEGPSKASGRTAALLTGSINVLRAAGIWDAVKDCATPLKIMKIVDDSSAGTERVEVAFHADDIGRDCFGYNIPNNALRAALIAHVKAQKNITHLCPDKLTAYRIDEPRVRAQTESGIAIDATLIIGTDGRGSIVRASAGIEAKKHDYEQMGMTCLITHTKPHHFTSTEFHRPGGPFTFVPMPGNCSSVVWVEKTPDAKKFLAMPKAAFEQAIQDRSHGLLGTITLASSPESWPLMLLSTDRLAGERSVIAAEAAHVLSPIGAQGLNLSLRDVAALAETIVDAARLGADIGCKTVLERYETRRRPDIKTRVFGIDGLNRIVANDRAILKDFRRLGLRSLENIPALKSFVMQQGLTPPMDNGRLLRGETL